eukprot:2972651-Amphidinium_carterae.1
MLAEAYAAVVAKAMWAKAIYYTNMWIGIDNLSAMQCFVVDKCSAGFGHEHEGIVWVPSEANLADGPS